MKRLLILFAALSVLPLSAQEREAFPSYIQVMGRAEREVVPDEFYLSIVINEKDSKGRVSVESQRKEMIAALRKTGVDIEKQLKLSNLSSEFFKKKSSVATVKYQLKLTSAEELSRVWQVLDGQGISNVSIVKVGVSDIDRITAEVRREAMQNARQTAVTLAEAVGQRIGPCFYVWDSNNDIMPRYYNNALMARSAARSYDAVAESDGADADDASVDFRNIKLEYSVQAKFVLLK